jgi:hypothetical protein
MRNKTNVSVWISGAALVISVAAFCGAWLHKGLVVENISIVLSVIGVLATFVIVGNFAQTNAIADRVDRELAKTEKRIDKLNEDLRKTQLGIAKIRAALYTAGILKEFPWKAKSPGTRETEKDRPDE